MSRDTFKVLALLSNATDSLVGLSLRPGLKVVRWTTEHALGILEELEGLPRWEVDARLQDQLKCTSADGQHTYAITGSVQLPSPRDDSTEEFLRAFRGEHAFDALLRRQISAARLYADGNLQIAALYLYKLESTGREMHMATGFVGFTKHLPFSIDPSARRNLKNFMVQWEPPFLRDYVQLAFENFEESFEAHSEKIEFLNLMIAMEILFNQGAAELRYRIARGVAVLLGSTVSEAQQIFSETGKLYDLRSQLVHTGSAKKLTSESLAQLRHYVRRSIIVVADLDKTKEDLSNWITWRGFEVPTS